MADHDLAHRIDRVLCALTEHFAEHAVAPAIRAVEIGDDVVLHLATVTESTLPAITVTDDGSTKIAATELEIGSRRARSALRPALISCGGGEAGVAARQSHRRRRN